MSAHLVSPELFGRSAEIGHLAGAFDNAPATVLVGGEAVPGSADCAAAVGGRRISHDLPSKVQGTAPIRSIVDAGSWTMTVTRSGTP
ncbi:hypothetical protein ALI22I_22220 [Saccharothrix sp. ALI-22-I]|uniref:hypothetical protein n=1 Tax=Saccharothrix sp. ALI-22-I TaxID=1933778 RepID=UPI00097C62FE|nr:hypothetical protein [Saccharothrix sp. ALI-22-I]ONI87176.1 hypothetical protein ALI22I_22220 [Saccharothrix sp. ALI-22-I]